MRACMISRSVVSNSVTPMDCSPPGSSVHGISQARISEWVAIPFCRGSCQPRDRTYVSCIGRWILYQGATREVLSSANLLCVCKSLSCVWLFVTPMDCSPPGSSIHGIFQARILEWVAISFSRRSSWPRDGTRVSCIAGRFFTVWATGWDIATQLYFNLKNWNDSKSASPT